MFDHNYKWIFNNLLELFLFDYNNNFLLGDARSVMVIVVGNGHGDTSSNPGPDWLHFT